MLLERLRNNFPVRLNDITASDVVRVKNVIPKIEFVPENAFAEAAFDDVWDGVDPDDVIDATAARGKQLVAQVAPGSAIVQHDEVGVGVWKEQILTYHHADDYCPFPYFRLSKLLKQLNDCFL